MDIILTLTIRHLKKNRKRTISTIVGILIASILLSLSFAFMASYLDMLESANATVEDIAPMMTAVAVMMAVILAVLAIFVHNMLSISARDRMNYLGMLGSVGATPMQRKKVTLLESLVLGGVAILPGIMIGSLLSFIVFPFPVNISWKSMLLLFLCEGVTLLLTGLLHAFCAGRGTVIELIRNRTDKRNLKNPVKLPGWILSRFGIEGHVAVKNLVFFKSRYLAIGISLVIAMVLLLDGFIYMKYLDGYYQVQDRREKKMADVLVQEEYGKKSDRWEEFVEEIITLPEIEEYEISKRASFGGILLDSDSMDTRMETFTTMIMNSLYTNPTTIYDKTDNKKQGYCMNMTLIGLDDAAFASYVKKAGITRKEGAKRGEIPVLIEDFPLIKDPQGFRYQSVLKAEHGSELNVWTDVDRAMIGAEPQANPITGFEKLGFYVLGVTDKSRSLVDANEGVMEQANTLKFYTTMDAFDSFMREHPPRGEQPEVFRSLALSVRSGVQEIPNGILCPVVTRSGNTITRQLKISSDGLSVLSNNTFQEILRMRAKEARKTEEEIGRIGEKYGLSDGSSMTVDEYNPSLIDYTHNAYPTMLMWELSDPFPLLRHLFVYGMLAFLLSISLFQMIKMTASAVQMRGREFAIFLSLGMSRRQMGKMLYMESLICNLVSFAIGLTISVLLAVGMFSSWKSTQAIEVAFPYQIPILQAAFFIMLGFVTLGVCVKSVKKTNIIDAIKDETV